MIQQENSQISVVVKKRGGFAPLIYMLFFLITLFILILCVGVGSASVSPWNTLRIILSAVCGRPLPGDISSSQAAIILSVRLPRVLCVALTGAALSISGAAMQGLLKNPLADGSTLGVSSGASLGAAISIAFGLRIPFLPFSATMAMAMLFAFLSLIFILSLAYRLDRSLSTNTIILIGIVFSMFISSILSLIVTFASDRVKHITFWTMGSLAGSSYRSAWILLTALVICSILLISRARELNAFSVGEENARHIGVNIRHVRLQILIVVSILIGVCVSIGGSIGFVGLVTPHIVRLITGPNHKKLLPACLFGGASFLMLADLAARILLNPIELPIGVVTSFIGAILFVGIYYRHRV